MRWAAVSSLTAKIKLVEFQRSPIAKVILGRKHGTPLKIVEDFLKLNHYGSVEVAIDERPLYKQS
jgi:hypothetical protein